MRKVHWLIIVIIGCLLIGCAGGDTKPKETLLKPHSDGYYGIMYPADFYATTSKETNGSYLFIALLAKEPDYCVSVCRFPAVARNITPADFDTIIQSHVVSLRDDQRKVVLSSFKFTLGKGYPAYKTVHLENEYGKGQTKWVTIVTYHKDVLILIMYTSAADKFDQRLGVFELIEDSFEFLF